MNVLPCTCLSAVQHNDKTLEEPAVQHNDRTLEKNGIQLIRITFSAPPKKSLLFFMISNASNYLTSLEVCPVIMGTTQ